MLDLAGGALTTRLTIAFVEQGPTDRRLELRGNAHVDGLAIKRRDGTPLVAANRIAVALDRVGVFDRQARIASVAIDAPRVDIMRLTDGTLELARPILDAPRDAGRPAPSPATPRRQERPWPFPSERSRSIMERRARRRVVWFPLDAHRCEARRDEPVDRAG